MSLPYLLATLPYQLFNTPAPITAEAFEAACTEQLAATDARTAIALLRGEPDDAPFARAWQEKETLIRNAVARNRNTLRGKDSELATRPTATADLRVNADIDAAFQAGDPGTRDTAIQRVRWHAVEELEGPSPISLNALFAYAVKLRINARRAAMTPEAAQPLVKELLDAKLPEGAAKTPATGD